MKLQLYIIIIVIIFVETTLYSQMNTLNLEKVKEYDSQLDDVIEIIYSVQYINKLKEVQGNYLINPNEINSLRLAILYHESVAKKYLYSKSDYKLNAQKSFDILSKLYKSSSVTKELLPFITAYKASSLSLIGIENKKPKVINQSFALFNESINNYKNITSLSHFLRASICQNLPWYYFSKKKYINEDFQSIMNNANSDSIATNKRLLSLTYFSMAKLKNTKANKNISIELLEKAIVLDPNYKAGRDNAQNLKKDLLKSL